MKKWILSIITLCLVFGWAGIAAAHSTKGRIRVVLEKKIITPDDTAYYIEPYVFEKKYKDKYERSYNRFGVAKFLNVEQKDGTARVSFMVLDWITKDKFEDYMLFKRNSDKTWSHIDDKGNVIHSGIKTWVKKKSMFEKLLIPVGSAVIFPLLFLLIYQRIKKRSQAGQSV